MRRSPAEPRRPGRASRGPTARGSPRGMWQNAPVPRCAKNGRRRQDSRRHSMRFHHWLMMAAGLAAAPAAAVDVNVGGLFPRQGGGGINRGSPPTTSGGERTPEGVLLVSVESSAAILEVYGKRQRRGKGPHIAN